MLSTVYRAMCLIRLHGIWTGNVCNYTGNVSYCLFMLLTTVRVQCGRGFCYSNRHIWTLVVVNKSTTERNCGLFLYLGTSIPLHLWSNITLYDNNNKNNLKKKLVKSNDVLVTEMLILILRKRRNHVWVYLLLVASDAHTPPSPVFCTFDKCFRLWEILKQIGKMTRNMFLLRIAMAQNSIYIAFWRS